MRGKDLLGQIESQLKKRGELASDLAISSILGITPVQLRNWRANDSLSALVVARSLLKSRDQAGEASSKDSIKPVVEYFPIVKARSKRDAAEEIFSLDDDPDGDHPYRAGLKKELCESKGVYIFYDSRGRALYVGKTANQSLWNEIKSAFNRDRNALQQIRRVNHPGTKKSFSSYDEKQRQIALNYLKLHEMAAYFSAYRVSSGMIASFEAVLIRSFANDLLNKKMENFSKPPVRVSASKSVGKRGVRAKAV